MDLLSIIQALWRRKFLAIPVILLTGMAGIYILKVKPPVYEASSSVMLITPSPPTAAQMAAHPRLRKISTANPYLAYGNLQIVADAVIAQVTSDAAQPALVRDGVDPRYTLSLSDDVGDPPIIEITGVGSKAEQAINSANVLTQAATTDLYTLQKQQNVNQLYMIRATSLVQPAQAQLSNSGKLRSLIAVLALGVLLLFIVISVADVIDKRRRPNIRSSKADVSSNIGYGELERQALRHANGAAGTADADRGWRDSEDARFRELERQARAQGDSTARTADADRARLDSEVVRFRKLERQALRHANGAAGTADADRGWRDSEDARFRELERQARAQGDSTARTADADRARREDIW